MKVFGEVEKLIDRDLKAALDVKVQAQTTRGMKINLAYLNYMYPIFGLRRI